MYGMGVIFFLKGNYENYGSGYRGLCRVLGLSLLLINEWMNMMKDFFVMLFKI